MTIRQPYAIYETDDGVSLTGTGPDIPFDIPDTGLIGDGCAGLASAEATPGIDVDGTISAGMFIFISAGNTGASDVIYQLILDNGTKHVRLKVNSDGDNTFTISVANNTTDLLSRNTALSNGWHHVGFSRASGTAQIYVDGSALGSTGTAASGATAGARTRASASEDYTPSVLCQPFYVALEYSGAEFAEIWNSAAGLAWANPWEPAAAASGAAIHLFRMMQG